MIFKIIKNSFLINLKIFPFKSARKQAKTYITTNINGANDTPIYKLFFAIHKKNFTRF